MTKRIEFISIAKGIAIILVIIGHTILFQSMPSNLIYSFHIPLFFILSGYTFKKSNNLNEFSNNVYKNFKRLMIPCFIAGIINFFVQCIIQEIWLLNGYEQVKRLVIELGQQLFWGSVVDIYFLGVRFPLLGMLWFLIALFWSKVIFDILQMCFKRGKGIVYFGICILGMLISYKLILPQNFDIALVGTFFLYIGELLKKYNKVIDKYKVPICIICLLTWVICFINGAVIQMALRIYPFFICCILCSICVSIVVIEVCESIKSENFVSKLLKKIGENTLIILLVHNFDSILIPWEKLCVGSENILFSICIIGIRVVCDIVVAWVIQKIVNNVKERRMINEE